VSFVVVLEALVLCSDIELEVQKMAEREVEEWDKLTAQYEIRFNDGYLSGLQHGWSQGFEEGYEEADASRRLYSDE
jgi:flagellar biosynthesis/type III secretory pathway protein FliH